MPTSPDRALARPSTAPGLGVCEWSPEGLYDKSVSLIPNTDEILQLVKKKKELSGLHQGHLQYRPGCTMLCS